MSERSEPVASRDALSRLKALEAAATGGEWYVRKGAREDRKGRRYGCEIDTRIPKDAQRAWQSAGFVPLVEVFFPSNPSSIHDPREAVEAEQDANAAFIATARNTYKALLAVAEAAETFQAETSLDDHSNRIAEGLAASKAMDRLFAALASLAAVVPPEGRP